MTRSDMMITFQQRGIQNGFNSIDSPSVRGHLRPIDHNLSSHDELRSGLLHNVGGGLDKGIHPWYIRSVQLFSSYTKGAQ
jgi:hypothetical protein